MGLFCDFENVNPGLSPLHEETCHAAYITSAHSIECFQARNQPGPGKNAQNHSQTENALFEKGGTTTPSRDAREGSPEPLRPVLVFSRCEGPLTLGL